MRPTPNIQSEAFTQKSFAVFQNARSEISVKTKQAMEKE
jgi:hypothetical protein